MTETPTDQAVNEMATAVRQCQCPQCLQSREHPDWQLHVNKVYATGLKVADQVMKSLNLERHAVCPNWNYTIRPCPAAVTCT